MMRGRKQHVSVILLLFSLLAASSLAHEGVPKSSNLDDLNDEVCSGGINGNCGGDDDTQRNSNVWKPFRLKGKSKWIAFDKLVERYVEWHGSALRDEEVPCQEKKVLIFTPNAGLGDSIGAVTTAFMYAIRTGRLFFIAWHPFPWSVMFKGLPFDYDYRKAANLNSKSGKPLICPSANDPSSFLSGHVTTEHPLVVEAKGYDFQTDYYSMSTYFLKPAEDVKKIMDDVVQQHFEAPDKKSVVLHKVAIVVRTGIGEYNQFLSTGDEASFVTCFKNYVLKFAGLPENQDKTVKFAVFVTSDNWEAKRNTVRALEHMHDEINLDIVTLEDSAIHVMHVTTEESKRVETRRKLRKTVAEFFLIGLCDARFLTHGSLFGRTAAELGGDREGRDFFISDSRCDGEREKYSYLECHAPKYPPICGLS